jgi:hypothetical protein
MMRLFVDLTILALIALMGVFAIFYPSETYHWFVIKTGRDEFGQWSPDRHPVYLWMHRLGGAVMFLGGLIMFALRIYSYSK